MSARTSVLSCTLPIDLTLTLGFKLKALEPRWELTSYAIFGTLQAVAYFMIIDSYGWVQEVRLHAYIIVWLFCQSLDLIGWFDDIKDCSRHSILWQWWHFKVPMHTVFWS